MASEKKRRIIVDNDGGDVFYCAGPAYEEFIASRFAGLAGTGATTVFYTTVSSGFSVFTHNTKIGSVRTAHEERHPRNIVGDLLARGTDCLQYAVRFCREHDMEIFWGMRMNDTHDGTGASYSNFSFRQNAWKLAHPACLLGSMDNRPRYGAWSAVNYNCDEVRELAFRFAEEVCQNYDVDGVHLDFFRHPVFFPSVADGRPAEPSELACMTALMRRIREMTLREGEKRGKPLLLSVRVPDSAEYARFLGLDLESWLSEGLVSLLCTASYLQLDDWEYSAALGHRSGVPVYPSLDETRIRDQEANALRMSPDGMRARCANALNAGADGVLLFNYIVDDVKNGSERYDVISDIANPDLLKRKAMRYFASFLGIGAVAGGAPPHNGYIRIPTLNPAAPLELENAGEVSVYIGEDCAGRQNAILDLVCEAEPGTFSVLVNGILAGTAEPRDGKASLEIDPALLKPGRNRITFHMSGFLRLLDLSVLVKGGRML